MKQDKDITLDAIVSELKETIYSLNIEDVRMNDVLSKFDNKVAINKKASKGLGFIFAFLMISSEACSCVSPASSAERVLRLS